MENGGTPNTFHLFGVSNGSYYRYDLTFNQLQETVAITGSFNYPNQNLIANFYTLKVE